ncbi:MAG TPA: DNA polymerase III subunit gamma/tau [Polyangia bacterium]|nr:DNA polymerase III subunit gamma/tau [Polyangia bacterium]
MSYLVLARKYRPQRFEDLVGQEHVARTLTNAIALERVHHAFLFTGARGVGKTSAARILAKALCCAQGPTATPCGVCDFCKEIASGQSVDVLEIDGASNTGVDDVRQLREAVRYLPSKGKKKVYIIDEVHMLSTSAFNALLKTLEEPPPHVVFVFATTEVHKIPSTIMSRCQRYDFKLIPTTRLVEHLSGILTAEKISFEPDGLRVVARQAAGSVRDGLSLLDQVIAYVGDQAITGERVAEVLGVADRRLLFQLVEAALARDVGQALRLVTQAVDRGVDLGQLAKAFLAHLHDVEIVGLVAEPGDVIDATADELAEARALAGKAPRGQLGAMFDRWARAVEEAAKSQSPRLILEMALVDLCFAEPLQPLGDLLQRLEEMEGRLGGGAPAPAPSSRTAAPPIARPAAIPSASPPPSVSPSPPSVAPPAARAEREPVPANLSPGEKWRRIRSQFEDRAMLAAALDHGEVTEWVEGRLTLVLPDKLTLDQVEKHRKDVERAIAAVSGQPTQLVLRQGLAGAGSAVRSEVGREADAVLADQRKREAEARQHPMIVKAQELFGVSPREIKTP